MKIKRFKGDTIVYFVAAVVLLVLGIVMIPGVTDLGQSILNIVIAVAILCYLFGFLLGKIKRSRQTIMILTVIEFVLLLLVALGLVLAQFKVINVSGACAILGLALALRGIVEMFRAYYHQSASNARYPLWQFIVNLIILILGVYMFARPFITDETLIWVMAVVCIAGAIICAVLGFNTVNRKKVK